MRESRGISVFKAVSRQGPKANSMKVKPEHLGWSNEQDQNNVQVGRNPGNLSSQHGQFFPSFCNSFLQQSPLLHLCPLYNVKVTIKLMHMALAHQTPSRTMSKTN